MTEAQEISLAPETKQHLFQLALQLGDDLLILGHRLSEWCGHGPYLEEDIALGNIALDCLGEAQNFLALAGELEGRGRTADTLAYFRNEYEFQNCHLVEQPNGDFAMTMARQLFYDLYLSLFLESLQRCSFSPLAGIAEKTLKETRYHLRHAKEWALRLGDGTAESQLRFQAAVDHLWIYTAELSEGSQAHRFLGEQGLVSTPQLIAERWQQLMTEILTEAQLRVPVSTNMIRGGREGKHSEQLGHLLAELQIVARSYPGATW